MIEAAEALFEGVGEMRARCRALDWSATPLGPVESWPATLRTIVRACLDSPFPINLWCGPQLALVYNDAYRAILGRKHPAALGRPGTEVWGEIWNDIAPLFDRLRKGGPPAYVEDAPFVVERDEGRTNAWFTFALSAVRDESGAIVAFLNIVSESTGRVLAERGLARARAAAESAESRLRDVFAQAPVFLAVVRGSDHLFDFANDAYLQLVGYRDIVGKPVDEALPEVSRQGFVALLDHVLATGEPYVGREVSVMISRGRGDGAALEERFLDFVYQPLRDPSGAPSGVIALGSDVTEQVLARRELERARETAEAARRVADAAREEADSANAAKSDFLATMSHEIRTPINAIKGYAQLLELGVAGPLTEQQREYLNRLSASSDHLLGLINDVLDLSKIDAGGLVVERESASTKSSIEAALELTSPQSATKGVRVSAGGERGAAGDALYFGDEDRVRQILVNLIGNAIKFTEPGGTVNVTAGESAARPASAQLRGAGPWAFVRVTDSGIGIAPEQQARVFEPFHQVSSGRTRRAGGTGLGLTISRRLAKAMGGDLTLESEPGVGSTFTLWLPTPDSMARDAASVRAAPAASRAGPLAKAGLAEVGEHLREVLEEVLADYSARLRAAAEIPAARAMRRAELEDHALSLLADLAQSLIIVAEGSEVAASLLRDGSAIQRTIAEHHGARRHAQGFSEDAVRRDHGLLREAVERVLRAAPRTAAGGLEEALSILRGLIDRVSDLSVRAWRSAERALT